MQIRYYEGNGKVGVTEGQEGWVTGEGFKILLVHEWNLR